MAQRKFKTCDIIIIVLFFLLYMIGYAWLIEPKKKVPKRIEKNTMMQQPERRQIEKLQPKSLSAGLAIGLRQILLYH